MDFDKSDVGINGAHECDDGINGADESDVEIYGADESQYKINGVDKSDLDEPMLTDDPDAKINPVVNVMLK